MDLVMEQSVFRMAYFKMEVDRIKIAQKNQPPPL